MADPAMAAARAVDQLTVQWLQGRVAELDAEVARLQQHVCSVIYVTGGPAFYPGRGW